MNDSKSNEISEKSREWHPIKAKDAKKIVLPHRPVFDKIVAAYIIAALQNKVLGCQEDFIEVEFRENQHPAPKTWERWTKEMAYVVDVETQKYQLQNQCSATSVIAAREGIFQSGGILKELAKIADKNNKTGYLKQYPNSIVWVLREMYKMNYPREEVVCCVATAICFWIEAQDPEIRSQHAERTQETLIKEKVLEKILQRAGGNFEDFTVSRFILDAYLVGEEVGQIVQWAKYFLDAKDEAKKDMKGLNDLFSTVVKRRFSNNQAILVRTNEERLARWILGYKNFSLVIVRKAVSDERKRNVVIMTKGDRVELKSLAALLCTLEGHAQHNQQHGKWYFDRNINAMLNGSTFHCVPATFLHDQQLQWLVEALVFKTRNFKDIGKFIDELIETQPTKFRKAIDRKKLISILQNGNGKK